MNIKEKPVSPEPVKVEKLASENKKKSRGRVKGSKNRELTEPFCIPGLEPNITTSQAASYLRLSPTTLNIWRVRGLGPKYWKIGGRVFYHKCDLESFLQSRRSTSEEVL